MTVEKITISKMPHHDHPFVHGVRDGKDVWLMNDGTWSQDECSEKASIPLGPSVMMLDGVRPCQVCNGIGYHHDIKHQGPDETRWYACGHCWGHGNQDSKGNCCGGVKTRPVEVKLRSKR